MAKGGKRRNNTKQNKSKVAPVHQEAGVKTASPAPPPRGSTNLCGIRNQGATCFLNALLQCLVFIPEIRDVVFQLEKWETGWDNNETRQTSIPLQLQLLFASLMLEQQQAVSSEGLTRSLGWTTEQVTQQQDAHELFMTLTAALKGSLRGTSGERLLQTMTTTTVQKITCFTCQKTSEIEAKENTIFLPVEGAGSLEESLLKHYIFPDVMVGEDKYRGCSSCQRPTNALKTTWVRRLPPVLTFALKRFSCTADLKPYKVMDMFTFPMELDMSQFTEGHLPHPDLIYELAGVIVHIGDCETGHYMACIQDVDDLGHWEMPNDDQVDDQLADEEVVRADLQDCVSAKQVVATVLSHMKKKGKMVPVERLSGEIGKQTGVPWAKSYRQAHGSFTKFLEANPDTFVLTGNQVGLVERPGTSGQRETSSGQAGGDTIATSPAPSSPGFNGNHFFLFSDSKVCPMAAKDVNLFAGGKISAYMLLYRQKYARRPAEAKSNPGFRIPPHVLEAIATVNQDLAKQRRDPDRRSA